MMTFTELTDRWKASKTMYVKQSTMAAYLLQLKTHIIPMIGHMLIEEIRSAHLQEMVGGLMDKRLSPKSVKDIIVTVHMILKFGCETMICPDCETASYDKWGCDNEGCEFCPDCLQMLKTEGFGWCEFHQEPKECRDYCDGRLPKTE